MNNKIELTGFVPHDKLPFWISKARVCIFTQDVSLGGRLPTKLLDYMASGRPIVATDVEEAWPVIEANSGIIVPRDPVKFADATIMLLEDDSLAEKLAKKGLDYVKKFDWQHILNKYIEVFEEILSSK